MKRTIATGINIWRQRCRKIDAPPRKRELYMSVLWPAVLMARALTCSIKGIPRGLIVEPSQGCTGGCTECDLSDEPAALKSEELDEWLKASPAKPVTIHFSGKHSDPLASPLLKELTDTARENCSMLSISTIGLGLKPAQERLPVDRWIFSIPAATEKSWETLRGNNRFGEALNTIRTVQQKSRAMVEVVFTIWKASVNDIEAFNRLIQKENWQHNRMVFGRFDPEGNHFGRLENIALNHEDCPYILTGHDKLILKNNLQGCPLAGYLFLDASGILRPCPFTGDESPHSAKPEPESWITAREWLEQKKKRSYPACEWCP